jgi:hypothetical protein
MIAADLIAATPSRASELSLVQVFPRADVLPENLLRFHLRFSRSVEVFDVNEHLRLIDTDQTTSTIVADPFLDLSDGLWSADGLTLTLMLHPGRIKSGLAAHDTLGTALRNTHSYALQVHHQTRGDESRTLANEWLTIKRFSVSAAVNRRIDADNIVMTVPPAATRLPLSIGLGHVVDRLASENFVAVTDDRGALVDVDVSTSESDTALRLNPQMPWRAGTYSIHFAGEFEDSCGNRFSASLESKSASQLVQGTTRLSALIKGN